MPLVATVTMNPAVDLYTSVDRVEPLRKLRCRGEGRDPGGGGINVARVARRLGAQTVAIFPAGGPMGDLLRRLVQAEGVPSRVIPISGDTREDVTIFDEGAHHRYSFILPGPRLRAKEWMECLQAVSHLDAKPAIICASGSLPPGVPNDFYARLGEIACELGASFVLDASGPALKGALDTHIHLVKPNLNEFAQLTGERPDTEAEMVDACRQLIAARRIEAVALTLAERGALLVTRRGGALRMRPPPLTLVSGVGAGDSFLGGMVSAMAEGKSLEEAFRVGAAAGSAAVLAPGTELGRRDDVRRLAPLMVMEDLASPRSEPV